MQTTVVVLVLLAAAMHATWNALVKGSRDRLLTQALVIGMGSAIALVALPFVNVPARESWPFLLLSVVAHNGYHAFLLLAYGRGQLSQVYPLARGVAPLTVALLAALLAGESRPFRSASSVWRSASGTAVRWSTR